MGTVLSVFFLLVGSLVTGVMSSVGADGARKSNWSRAKLFDGISLGVALALILFTIFILVRSHVGAGEITGVIEELAFGVMISFILMILAMVGVAVLDVLALIEADKKSGYGRAVGAAVLSFGSFVLSLIIIIFLL